MILKYVIIYGSARSNRLGMRAVNFAKNTIIERGHRAEIIDPITYPFPILEKTYKDYTYEELPDSLKKAREILNEADGIVFVAGEYNHSLQPGLTNIIDHFHTEFSHKPNGIISFSNGIFAGVRAAEHLRIIAATIGSVSIPKALPIPQIENVLNKDGSLIDDSFNKRIHSFLDELDWYVKALKSAKEQS